MKNGTNSMNLLLSHVKN